MPPKFNLSFAKKPSLGSLSKKSEDDNVSVSSVTTSSDYDDDGARSRVYNKLRVILGSKTLATRCEMSLYLHMMDSEDFFPEAKYLRRALVLIRNLDPNGSVGNDYLHSRVVQGQIRPEDLAKMSPKDLFPRKWDEIREERLREIQKENEQSVAISDMYTCRKCFKDKTTFYQLQIRSQDEPMTTFITCLNCGTKWSE